MSERRDSVTFLETQRRYSPREDLKFVFRRAPELVPTTRDWVGLFRVGWTSSRDYYTFEWVPKPAQERLEDTVSFAGNRLPPEDGYFYQVCYVSRDGTVRGASAPFQFCQPATSVGMLDDLELVEVQDEGMSLMMLQHKNKDEVEQLRQDVAQHRDELSSVQSSFAALRVEKETLAGQLSGARTEKETLEGNLAEKQARIDEVEGLLRQREARVRELATQLTKQDATLSAQLAEKEVQRADLENQLQAANHELERERAQVRELLALKSDEEGQIQLLQRKVEEYQVRLVASQAETSERSKELQVVSAQVEECQANMVAVQGQVSDLRKELKIKEAQVGDLRQLTEARTEEIEQLTEKLDDCLSKLEEERTKVENVQSEKVIEFDELQQEIATQQENIVELTGVNEMLNQQLQELQNQPPVGPGSGRVVDKSIYEALHQAYENMEEYFRNSEAENKSLRAKLHQSQELVMTMQGKCDELLKRIEFGKTEYEAKARELEQLRQRRPGDRSREVAELQVKIREMEETEEQLTQACGDAVRELTARKEEGKRQETRISELEDQLHQLQSAYDQLEERHDAKIQEKNTTLDQQQYVLDSKLAELADLRQTNEQLVVVRDDLTKQVQEMEDEKWQLSEQLRAARSERDALKIKVQEYKSRQQHLQETARLESQRMCPVCDTRFPARMTQEEYERHVQGHFQD